MPSDAPLLIVNADDLGHSPGINAAIFEAHDRGIVTSASLLAAGEAFEEALAGLRARPRLGCGVHLALHDERPLAPRERVTHLLGEEGRMRPLHPTARALLFGRIPDAEVEAEYRAQIERVLAAGVRPTHLDSHCHLHCVPRVAAIVHRLGRELGIPCARRPETAGFADYAGAPIGRWPVAWAVSALHRRGRARIADPLAQPARFLGLVKSGTVDTAWFERALEGLPRGAVSELMVHPGDGRPGERYGDHSPALRKREFDALVAPSVRAALERQGVRLVNYTELARA